MNAVIVVGHGSPRPEANDTLPAVARLLADSLPGWIVRHAFLRFGTPGFEDAVQSCIEEGATRIVVHPYFLTTGGHVTRDLPEMVDTAARSLPGVTFGMTPPLGVHPGLVEVILARIEETGKEAQ